MDDHVDRELAAGPARSATVEAVLSGRASYDDLHADEQAEVRVAWQKRIDDGISRFRRDLAAELEAGETLVLSRRRGQADRAVAEGLSPRWALIDPQALAAGRRSVIASGAGNVSVARYIGSATVTWRRLDARGCHLADLAPGARPDRPSVRHRRRWAAGGLRRELLSGARRLIAQ